MLSRDVRVKRHCFCISKWSPITLFCNNLCFLVGYSNEQACECCIAAPTQHRKFCSFQLADGRLLGTNWNWGQAPMHNSLDCSRGTNRFAEVENTLKHYGNGCECIGALGEWKGWEMWFIELEESTWKELMDFESVSIGFFFFSVYGIWRKFLLKFENYKNRPDETTHSSKMNM